MRYLSLLSPVESFKKYHYHGRHLCPLPPQPPHIHSHTQGHAVDGETGEEEDPPLETFTKRHHCHVRNPNTVNTCTLTHAPHHPQCVSLLSPHRNMRLMGRQERQSLPKRILQKRTSTHSQHTRSASSVSLPTTPPCTHTHTHSLHFGCECFGISHGGSTFKKIFPSTHTLYVCTCVVVLIHPKKTAVSPPSYLLTFPCLMFPSMFVDK